MSAPMKLNLYLVCFWPKNTLSSYIFYTKWKIYPLIFLMRKFQDQNNGCTYYFYPGTRKNDLFFAGFGLTNFHLGLKMTPIRHWTWVQGQIAFWNTDAYKSLSLYNSNEGSCVAVCCICHILEQILLTPPHNSYFLQISNVFIYTQLQASVQT